MDRRPRIGLSPHLLFRPLVVQLLAENRFAPQVDFTGPNAIRLRERELDAALLSPLDFARESSDYRIVRGSAVSSPGADGSIVLVFREGVEQVTTLAADPTSFAEIVLARIILAEEFDLHPRIVPAATGSPAELLRHADAALLYGDAAFHARKETTRALDLVEAWAELTELPYVHGIWCGYEDALNAEDREVIAACHAGASAARTAMGPDVAEAYRVSPADVQEYLGAFTYMEIPGIEEAIKEFASYAFFHGILPDVPDLRFYGDPDGDASDD
jgi:predicted solute-binding protein